jgi:hypothetical protein
MPIIITWDSGERQAFIGPAGDKLLDTRYPIVKRFESGHTEHLVKDKIRSIEDVTDDDWNKMVEAQSKARDGQEAEKKRQAEEHAKAEVEKRKRDEEAAAAVEAAWRRKFFLVRLFSKRPYPEAE